MAQGAVEQDLAPVEPAEPTQAMPLLPQMLQQVASKTPAVVVREPITI